MCDKDIELCGENRRLLNDRATSKSLEVNNHQTTVLLSDGKSSASPNRGISKDSSIRYDNSVRAGAAVGACRLARYGQLRSTMSQHFQGKSHRACTFIIGVVYSVFTIGVAAASLGYRYDVQNDSYGFRALLEGTAILATVTFIASLGLVYGVIENRRSFVAAWLALQVVVPLYTTIFYAWTIYASGIKNDFGPIRTGVPYVGIIAAVNIGAMIGCTLIVNKYYLYLKVRESIMKKIGVDSS